MAATGLLHGLDDGLGHEHHAGPPAEGAVVHDAVAALAKLAEVDEIDGHQPAHDSPTDHAGREPRGEQTGEEGHDRGMHGGRRVGRPALEGRKRHDGRGPGRTIRGFPLQRPSGRGGTFPWSWSRGVLVSKPAPA